MTKDRQAQERNRQELERRLARIERRFGMSLLQERLRLRAAHESLAPAPGEADSSQSHGEP